MYKLLIVDDDSRVREGLKKLIGWQELGFHVAGDAGSGAEALAFIEREPVEVVLTDIVMPGMNGLELLGRLKEMSSPIKTIVLSSYDEFDYARTAMRLGTIDYLTKPIDFDELRVKMRVIRQLLDKEAETVKKEQSYLQFIQEQFCNRLVKGMYKDRLLLESDIERMCLDVDFGAYFVVRAYLEAPITGADYTSLKNEAAAMLQARLGQAGRGFVFHTDLQEFAAVISTETADSGIPSELATLLEMLAGEAVCSLYFGIGGLCTEIHRAAEAYAEAGKALELRTAKKDTCVFTHADLDRMKHSSLIIEKAKQYIDEHYGTDITLNTLSELLFIHPNYFSKLFKEQTGQNFIAYLTLVRIEKAKLLLKDVSLKIYEVAVLTGFCHSKYFGAIFKEHVGMTPKEFRNSIV